MKKLAALLAAVLLIACISLALAQTESREDYIGEWTLYSLLMGDSELPGSTLDIRVMVNIHEDDTITFGIGDRFCVVPLTYGEGCVSFDAPMVAVVLTMGEDGMLTTSVEMEGNDLELRLQRSAVSVPSAELAPLVGCWKVVKVTVGGAEMLLPMDAGVSMSVYDDGYVLMSVEEDSMGAKLNADAAGLSLTDDAGSVYPMELNAQGQLILYIDEEDLTMVLTMEREAAAEESSAASFSSLFGKMVQQASQLPVGLEGVWVCTGGTLNGVPYTAAQKGLDITLTVREGVDMLNYGGNIVEREAIEDENTVTIGGICFVLNDEGALTYTMNEDGYEIVIILERQAD